MKIILSDFKKNLIKVRITHAEDLWYLSQIIEEKDLISGKTVRKVTIGTQDDKTVHVQKPAFLQINVERLEFTPHALRVSGKIVQAPDDIPRGSYHTLVLEQDTEWTIEKEQWLTYHKAQLEDAVKASHVAILIAIFDRDDCTIALFRSNGYEVLTSLRSEPEKKEKRAQAKTNFYPDIINALESYNERYLPQSIILASPAFYKEDLLEQIKEPAIKKKIILATCSSAGEHAIDEVLKRQETRTALQQIRIAQETTIVEHLLNEIGKNGLAAYGINEVKRASEAGAVTELLVAETLIKEYREKGNVKELNSIMRKVDETKGKIHMISHSHDAGKKLHGLGGIAALLRYKLEW